MLLNPIMPIFFGLFGLLCAFLVYLQVKSANEGTGRVKEIGDEIHLGAMVFMAAEYKILSMFCVICLAALYYFLGWETALAFFAVSHRRPRMLEQLVLFFTLCSQQG